MKRVRSALFSLFIVLGFAIDAVAADKSSLIYIYTPGNWSGGRFAPALDASRDGRIDGADSKSVEGIYVRGWIYGYLTAQNEAIPKVVNILSPTDYEGAMQWLTNYGYDHPTDVLFKACSELVKHLRAKGAR